ncbi:hypothetical protein QFC20_005822, partial [Naganishia adeliensis]
SLRDPDTADGKARSADRSNAHHLEVARRIHVKYSRLHSLEYSSERLETTIRTQHDPNARRLRRI